MNNISIVEMEKLQLDNFNMQASECLPVMLSKLDKTKLNKSQLKVIDDLSKWNFYNEANMIEPAYFEMWKDTFKSLLWDEFYHADFPMRIPEDVTMAHFIIDEKTSVFYDIKSTSKVETLQDLLLLSFEATSNKITHMTEKNWSEYKHTTIEHLAKIPAFTIDYVACGGNKSIVNATSKYHGPSWRMIVEMTDDINAVAIYPGGQSGNPGSKYYDNFVQDWSEGKYYQVYHSSSIEEMKKHASITLVLNP
jgi:penicillin amidase